jgi:hypothetical protein
MNRYEQLSKHYGDKKDEREREKKTKEDIFKRIQDNLAKELGCGYEPRIKVEGSAEGACKATVGFIVSKNATVATEFTIVKTDGGHAVRLEDGLHDVSDEAGWTALWTKFFDVFMTKVDEQFHEKSESEGVADQRHEEDKQRAEPPPQAPQQKPRNGQEQGRPEQPAR